LLRLQPGETISPVPSGCEGGRNSWAYREISREDLVWTPSLNSRKSPRAFLFGPVLRKIRFVKNDQRPDAVVILGKYLPGGASERHTDSFREVG